MVEVGCAYQCGDWEVFNVGVWDSLAHEANKAVHAEKAVFRDAQLGKVVE